MATINGSSIRNRIYAGGAHGNVSVAMGFASLNAAEVADVVNILEIPAGIQFLGVRVSTPAGLGTDVAVTVKVGDEVLASSVDVAAAATVVKTVVPFITTEKAKLTVTIAGGEATGDIHIIPEYVAIGTI